MSEPIKNRYDFILLFDVKDGNPNGDPDAGNLPRIDPETGNGIVTDVCLKRKIRNYVSITKEGEKAGNSIFIREKAVLNKLIEESYDQPKVKSAKKEDQADEAKKWMCKTYFDIRTFGAVLSTGSKTAGQVRGPVQLTFGRSVDPIVILENTITRMAVTNEADAKKERTMGTKNTVPYGLYTAYGFISPHLAAQTGFSEDDLKLFWEALENMFEHDHSAARGMMSTCKLIVFEHKSALGNAPSKELFQKVKLTRKDEQKPPRDFSDYELTLPKPGDLPADVKMIVKP